MRSLLLTLLVVAGPGAPAAGSKPDSIVARATRDIVGPRVGFEDAPLTEIIQRGMMEATRADVALCSPLPRDARIRSGSLTAGKVAAALGDVDLQIFTTTMTGRQIQALLERTASRFAPYDFNGLRPLLSPAQDDSLIDSFEGLSYELDLTRPEGDRVVHLAFQGATLDPERRLVVAVDSRRMSRGDLETPADPHAGAWLQEAVIRHIGHRGVLDGSWEPNWSILPDYALTPQRPLIDRLVRHGGTPREDVLRLYPEQPARRGEMAYRLARAFGWRERRPSGAFPDVPDSLEPWVDGLLRRDVLGTLSRAEFFQPFAPLTADLALEWCEAAARRARYALAAPQDEAFRRSLLVGVATHPDPVPAGTDTLSHAQMLALIGNLRFPAVKVVQDSPGAAARTARGTDPEDPVWLAGPDTVVVRRGVRLGLARRRVVGTDRSELTVSLGSTSTPLGPERPGDSGPRIHEIVVDPVALRTLEVVTHPAGGPREPRPAND